MIYNSVPDPIQFSTNPDHGFTMEGRGGAVQLFYFPSPMNYNSVPDPQQPSMDPDHGITMEGRGGVEQLLSEQTRPLCITLVFRIRNKLELIRITDLPLKVGVGWNNR